MQNSNLTERMLKEFGPLMGGEELRRALGYRTGPAFSRAVRLNAVGLLVFEIPNRRGKFALTIDVATWLAAQRAHAIEGNVSLNSNRNSNN
jgi:hypothetical protein